MTDVRQDLEAELSLATLEALHQVSYHEAGLILAPEKVRMVQSRLRHRLRETKTATFEGYLALIRSDAGTDERRMMISALTTNVSQFFREPHHFDILGDKILPRAQVKLKAGGRFRIWSAGCSNGQEAFSIAMHLLDHDPSLQDADFRILATDVDPKVIAFARDAVYPDRMLQGIPDHLRKRFLQPVDNAGQPAHKMTDALRQLIRFKELNLLKPWPMNHVFDAIFCRNVVIYFDSPTQDALWPRFHSVLAPDGVLFLGHSERVPAPEALGFCMSGPTAYDKSPTFDTNLPDTFKRQGKLNGTS
ncbi:MULTISPECIES: CheR family methyltransferase [Roseobacteraceae]|jgi:chemotaxis protein methyltransferase CheR|uniref:Chemotaxis protein methyltransferase n=1 Tax=Pseudosulfitobacter pseudonitzschiae TaxID=1402135 RepID=A0A221K0B4_9RHOB|nr:MULTISPECIES: protein-glutamate O-methyltransferase CheR [Roseobacteraceae]ASM72277.1 chemotaxis protein methyltransferase [Pseudosulfitobacter pseudonitzschiae]